MAVACTPLPRNARTPLHQARWARHYNKPGYMHAITPGQDACKQDISAFFHPGQASAKFCARAP